MNVHCDKSPDGRHKFDGIWNNSAFCIHCEREFKGKDWIAILNAALRLTAEEAALLTVYANARRRELEGKNVGRLAQSSIADAIRAGVAYANARQ